MLLDLEKTYDSFGIFLPPNLRKGVFLILVNGNIDKNARANLIQSHYHETSISILQFPEFEGQGYQFELADYINLSPNTKKSF